MSSSSPMSSSGASPRPVGYWPWVLRLGLGITALVLTVVILVVLALGRKPDDSNGPVSLDVSPSRLSFRNVDVGAKTSPQDVTLVSRGEGLSSSTRLPSTALTGIVSRPIGSVPG